MKRLILLSVTFAILALVVAACGGGGKEGSEPTSTPEGATMSFAEACQKTGEKQFSQAPPTIIDTSKTYVATIVTGKGDIVLELSPDQAPITVNNFVFLSCKGFYDGVVFHRVEPGFVIQGGDPTGTGTGGPGYTIPGEFEGSTFDAGVLGMASRIPAAASSSSCWGPHTALTASTLPSGASPPVWTSSSRSPSAT
jgi:peptidylprolyl isomerase